jgi:hypothetical protein
MNTDEEKHFEYALGFAVVRRWTDLSRETQQLLFDEATAGDDSLREGACDLSARKASQHHAPGDGQNFEDARVMQNGGTP